MNESKKIDPRELSPLALAFVGDSVLELLVRQRLAEHHRLSAGRLNAEKVKYVSARAQFREEQLLSRCSPRTSWLCSSVAAMPARPVSPSTPPRRNTVPPPASSACWAGCI